MICGVLLNLKIIKLCSPCHCGCICTCGFRFSYVEVHLYSAFKFFFLVVPGWICSCSSRYIINNDGVLERLVE